jgi:hypothetical protein
MKVTPTIHGRGLTIPCRAILALTIEATSATTDVFFSADPAKKQGTF